MERTVKGLLVFFCALVFLAVAATDGRARMGRKPTILGPRGAGASFMCEEEVCECHGVKDCVRMVASGVCKGRTNCDDDGCRCTMKDGDSLKLKRSPGKFRGFQK